MGSAMHQNVYEQLKVPVTETLSDELGDSS